MSRLEKVYLKNSVMELIANVSKGYWEAVFLGNCAKSHDFHIGHPGD